jgi:hypothetical protein
MRIAFFTEMGFTGKISEQHTNMRTEFAWMHKLQADHFSIYDLTSFSKAQHYDKVFIIFPKGNLFLNAVGSRVASGTNPVSNLLQTDIVSLLKNMGNKEVYYVQEGPHWMWNDYEVIDQIGFYNFVSSCDGVYAHNQSDVKYYKGMFPHLKVGVIPTLMIETLVKDITPIPEDKVIIGGNFARWYGGFESFVVATEFEMPIWAQTSHATREHEIGFEGLHHLPRMLWLEWMKKLSTFKYAVHLMPTVAAGTFSLNCAYFGIPTIGNIQVDTQRECHPNLAVEVNDIETARNLAKRLRDDIDFYKECSNIAQTQYIKMFSTDHFNLQNI